MKYFYLLLALFICTSAKSQQVIPQKGAGSKFFINCANMYFEVDSARGARITSFKLDDNELMYVDFKKTDMAGSTFWQSPQTWSWPPAVNLDSKPYRAIPNQNKIVFKGATDPKSLLRFYKTISANAADTSIIIDYCIKNEKAAIQKWAPWEITRVANSGLTVFAKGVGNVTSNDGMDGRTQTISSYVWYDQDATVGGPGNKFFCDGKGWLAHVVDGEMLFIKKFEDVVSGKAAPNEAEIEVYTDPNNTYTELENQGVYTNIASKDSISWRVKWFARKLPVSVEVKAGSTSLTNYIEAVLKREAPVTGIDPQPKNEIRVYPNPATTLLSVETGKAIGKNAMLLIFDIQGRMVLSSALTQSNNQINVERLLQGLYIYEIRQGNESFLKGKITIDR
jgi:hypothetical protein